MITFANVESAKWFITDREKSRQEKVEKWNEEKRAQMHTVIEPKKILQNALRVMSVGEDFNCGNGTRSSGDLLARVCLVRSGANLDI